MKLIEVYEDKAGEYRWRKIRGSKIVSVQGEGHPSHERTMAAAQAESEDGEFEVRDLTGGNIKPEEVENAPEDDTAVPEGAETVPVQPSEEPEPPAEM